METEFLESVVSLSEGSLEKVRRSVNSFMPRVFASFYMVKKEYRHLEEEEKRCLLQERTMQEIRKSCSEFVKVRTFKEEDGTEYHFAFGLSLQGTGIKIYNEMLSGMKKYSIPSSLPFQKEIMALLEGDKTVETVLSAIIQARLISFHIRESFRATNSQHLTDLTPLEHSFYGSTENRVSLLYLTDKTRLYALRLSQTGIGSGRWDISVSVKGVRPLGWAEYERKKEGAPNSNLGVLLLGVSPIFVEDPLIERAPLMVLAESSAEIMPKLIFAMEHSHQEHDEDNLQWIIEGADNLRAKPRTEARFYRHYFDKKPYTYFSIENGNSRIGNMIAVEKIQGKISDAFIASQDVLNRLKHAFLTLEEKSVFVLKRCTFRKQKLPQGVDIARSQLFRQISQDLSKQKPSLECDLRASKPPFNVLTVKDFKREIVFADPLIDNAVGEGAYELRHTMQKLITLDLANPQQVYSEKSPTPVLAAALKMRYLKKLASIRGISSGSENLPLFSVRDFDLGVSLNTRATILVPIGVPGEQGSGIISLTSHLREVFVDGGFTPEFLDFGLKKDLQFRNEVSSFLDHKAVASGEYHTVFFYGSKHFSKKWQVGEALIGKKNIALAFLPKLKDRNILVLDSEMGTFDSQDYAYSDNEDGIKLIFSTRLPPGIRNIRRHAYKVWDLQTTAPFQSREREILMRVFIALHVKSLYLSGNQVLGSHVISKIISNLEKLYTDWAKMSEGTDASKAVRQEIIALREKCVGQIAKGGDDRVRVFLNQVADILARAESELAMRETGAFEILSNTFPSQVLKRFCSGISNSSTGLRFPLGVLS